MHLYMLFIFFSSSFFANLSELYSVCNTVVVVLIYSEETGTIALAFNILFFFITEEK